MSRAVYYGWFFRKPQCREEGVYFFFIFDRFTLGREEASLSVDGSVYLGNSKGISAIGNDVKFFVLPQLEGFC